MNDTALDLSAVQQLLSELLPKAGEMVLESFQNTRHVEYTKDDKGDFTTEVDIKTDAFLVDAVRSRFPDANFLTEETAGQYNTQELELLTNLFIIDPIDGTANYARGNPNFGISVGLVDRGITALGAIYLPVRDQLIIARNDRPNLFVNNSSKAWCVSDVADLKQATVLLDMPHAVERKPIVARWIRVLSNEVRRVGMEGSAVSDMMKLARGEIDAYIHPGLLPWDVAAASLILKKSGAVISCTNGKEWNVFSPEVVASNSPLHEILLGKIS